MSYRLCADTAAKKFWRRAAGGVLFLAISAKIFAAPPGDLNSWALVWSDEFNGATNAAPSSTLWGNPSQLPWGGNHHNPSYASVVEAADSYQDGNGNLVLRCRYVPGGIVAADGTTQYYTEGLLNNYKISDFTYGYVEINAEYPTATSSQWPAFWLNSSGNWPPEIDIAEYWSENGSTGGHMHNAIAWNSNNTVQWDSTTLTDGNYGGFHTYGLDWGEANATWYKDGVVKKSNTTGADIPNQAMYVILNSGVTSDTPPPGATGYPTFAMFDYFRYYRRSELVYNSDFEAWNGAWNIGNNAGANAGQGVGGSLAMSLNTNSGGVTNSTASQLVYGLLPNTAYVLSAWYHNNAAVNSYWPGLNVNVTPTGGGSLLATAWGGTPNWTRGLATFTTGPVPTNVTVSFQVQPTWGQIFLDNVLLQRAATVNNPGFETSYEDPFWQTSGPSFLLQTAARSGSYAQQFHTNSSARQIVAGLLPGTTYNLKLWVTGPSGPGLQVSVTNSDGVNVSTTVHPTNAYQSVTLVFTTGVSDSTATIIMAEGTQSADYVYFADDLFLAQPLPATWQGQDIGNVGLAGASGLRGSKFALEGSGAAMGGTNDAFYYVYQPLTNDGRITAQICTEQNTGPNAQCGVMMRQSLDPGAPCFFVNLLPQNILQTTARSASGGAAGGGLMSVPQNPWVRVQRNGNVFSGWYSWDGVAWQLAAQQTITMSNTVLLGLAASSGTTSLMNESVFDHVNAQAGTFAGSDTWTAGAGASVLGDSFTVSGIDSNARTNLNYNLAGRQSGLLAPMSWVGLNGAGTQVGNPTPTNLLVAFGPSSQPYLGSDFAPTVNAFNLPMSVSFLGTLQTDGGSTANWFACMLSSAPNGWVNQAQVNCGILFRQNGQAQIFSGGNALGQPGDGAAYAPGQYVPVTLVFSDVSGARSPFNGNGSKVTAYANGVPFSTNTIPQMTNGYVGFTALGYGPGSWPIVNIAALQVSVVAPAGTAATNFNWNVAGNWFGGNNPPLTGESLTFGGTAGLNNTNNYPTGTLFTGIGFDASAGAFTLGGNGLTLGGNLNNSAGSVETINLPLALTNAIAVSGGNPGLVMNGVISGANGLTCNSGTVTLSGQNTFTGPLTVNGGTVILTGSNTISSTAAGGPVNAGGTLQLVANSGNTSGGYSAAWNANTMNFQIEDGGTLQLRSDSSVTFGNTPGTLGAVSGSSTVTLDVNQATAGHSGNTLAIWPGGIYTYAYTINVTGGNGCRLNLGGFSGYNGPLTFNPTTANLLVGSITAVSALNMNGTGSLTLYGTNTYTGTTTVNSGTLQAGGASAFAGYGALAMAGDSVLNLNGYPAEVTDIASSVSTATITDNSTGPGSSTLTRSSQNTTANCLIKDGSAHKVAVTLINNNGAVMPFAYPAANTFSGGLTLANASPNGTRLRISGTFSTVGNPGAISSSPLGTGPIYIGQGGTDKAAMLLDTVAGINVVNAIVFNTALGTDTAGGVRSDTANELSGTLTANLAPVEFVSGTAGGQLLLAGQVTGAQGLVLQTNAASALTITLSNVTANANNYGGDTVINGTPMTLVTAAANQIPHGAGAGNLVNNGKFKLNGFSQTINGLSGTGVVDGGSGTPTLTLGQNNVSTNFPGNIVNTAGQLSLVKTGTGLQTISGSCANSGNLTVSNGTLELVNPPAWPTNAAVNIAGGATLKLDTSATTTVGSLVLNGISQPKGLYPAAKAAPFLAGNGSLQVLSGPGIALNPTNLMARVSAGNLILSWPADHLGWTLQWQTNSLARGLGTNWLNLPGSSIINVLTNPIYPASGSTFYRLASP